MSVVLIKFVVSIGLVALVFWWVDGADVLWRLSGVSIPWMTLGVVALSAATFSMARRWQIVAAHLGLHLSFWASLREYYLGSFINQVVPGGVTGDIARAVRARHGANLRTAALSVALERFLGQVAVFLVLAFGLAFALILPGGIAWPKVAWVLPAGVLTLACASVFFLRGNGVLHRFTRQSLRLLPRPELICHGALVCACLFLGFYACARAVGILIPPAGWMTLIPLILCAMLVPISIGGWGWREGSAATLFPLIGADPSAGVAAGITYGGASLLAALPAVAILFTRTLNKSNPTLPNRGSSCPNPPT